MFILRHVFWSPGASMLIGYWCYCISCSRWVLGVATFISSSFIPLGAEVFSGVSSWQWSLQGHHGHPVSTEKTAATQSFAWYDDFQSLHKWLKIAIHTVIIVIISTFVPVKHVKFSRCGALVGGPCTHSICKCFLWRKFFIGSLKLYGSFPWNFRPRLAGALVSPLGLPVVPGWLWAVDFWWLQTDLPNTRDTGDTWRPEKKTMKSQWQSLKSKKNIQE